MTHEEIEVCRRELADILRKRGPNGKYKPEVKSELRSLAEKVGASTQTVFLHTVQGGIRNVVDAEECELAYNIHHALQTASMIDACRTAAKNVALAENAQTAASRAQQVAFWSMLAAWGAVVVNIVVAYIM